MLDEVIAYLVDDMSQDIQEIIERYQGRDPHDRKMKGDIGEIFVGRSIKYALLNMGRRYHPSDFWIETQIGADPETNQGGIDFRLTVTYNDGRKYVFLIEAKNWDERSRSIISQTFEVNILDRFVRVDSNHESFWVITMNRGNIEGIADGCRENDIHIIPLDYQLTADLDYNEILEPVIRSFIVEFSRYVREILHEDDHEDIEDIQQERTIIEFVMRGVPDRIIIRKFGISTENLEVIKSKLRREGVDIVYRRSKDGKQIKEL